MNRQQMASLRWGPNPIYCYYRNKKKRERKNTKKKLGKQENETTTQKLVRIIKFNETLMDENELIIAFCFRE